MRRRRVVIIGGGFSGAATAVNLLLRDAGPEVILIERTGRAGPGLAYGGRDNAHLLNVRANNLSISAAKPDDFAHWLARRLGGDQSATFAPRPLYGRYVAEAVQRAESRRLLSRLKRMRANAVAVRPSGAGVSVSMAGRKDIVADAAVLAFGNPAAIVPDVLNGVRVVDAWDSAAIAAVPSKDDVLLVGTGLTMIDVVLSLSKRLRTGAIYALSHRGLVPRAHRDNIPPAVQAGMTPPARLSQALFEMRLLARGMAERGEPWQHVVDRLRQATPALWRGLSTEQQLRFLRHARPYWDVHRHRAAPEAAARIEALQKEGKLRILAGEIASAQPAGRNIQIMHRQRGSMVRHRFEVAHVVNCTGASQDLSRSHDPLVMQLLSEGVARRHATGLGLDVDDTGRVIDASGVASPCIFALGPITQGAFWESTAVPEIRARAAALAAAL